MDFAFGAGSRHYLVSLDEDKDNFVLHVGDEQVRTQITKRAPGALTFLIEDKPQLGYYAIDGDTIWVHINGKTDKLDLSSGEFQRQHAQVLDLSPDATVRAPMPGQIRSLRVKEGGIVEKGEVILILEAMKMEIRILATQSGFISRLPIREGERVERDSVLAEIGNPPILGSE